MKSQKNYESFTWFCSSFFIASPRQSHSCDPTSTNDLAYPVIKTSQQCTSGVLLNTA